MAQFSGAVRIGDVSDFIAPTQACLHVRAGPSAAAQPLRVQAPPPPAGGFQQTTVDAGSSAIKVTLQDCLACSGCVTSAETVLLQQQSTDELLRKLADPRTTVIATLSPQTRASLAAAHGMGVAQANGHIVGFLKALGVSWVLDAHVARGVSLRETAAEFIARYRAAKPQLLPAERAADTTCTCAEPSDAAAGVRACEGDTQNRNCSGGSAAPGPLPMLASACPGWVCYAEKTHGEVALPYISAAKSPQAVAGTLVKRTFCVARGLDPAAVYHVAVMPCFDKKLEASRADFNLPGNDAAAPVPEVDCVITTLELHDLLAQRGALDSFAPAMLDAFLPGNAPPLGKLSGVRGGSGGYMEYVLKTAARELFGEDLGPGPLRTAAVRNADLQEVAVQVGGRVVLRGAIANGFRNIQGLMRKIKLQRCEYDYVEVMACPSGCLNGGGQVKVAGGQAAIHARLEQLDALYHAREDVELQLPEDDEQVRAVYRDVVHAEPGSTASAALFHTHYHRREKSITSSLLDW